MRNFLFHRVHPKRDKLWDPMDPALFEKCIKYITKNYDVVSLEEYVLSEKKYNSHKKVATILFDDGYKDNIEYAVPILQKYKCPASFYIVTECIDKNIPTWTHIVEYLFQNTKKSTINFDTSNFPLQLQKAHFSNEVEKLNYIKQLKPYLKSISHTNRLVILNQVQDAINDVSLPQKMMSWSDIKELSQAGYKIGSHTVTHAMLGTINDEQIVEEELLASANAIEKQVGSFPKTISYPVGSYNSTTIKLSQKVGYKIGLAVKQDTYKPERDNIYEIPRIELYNEPWFKTRLRITNHLEEIKSLIGYKKHK